MQVDNPSSHDIPSFIEKVWLPEREITTAMGHRVAFYFVWVYGSIRFRVMTCFETKEGLFNVAKPCTHRGAKTQRLVYPVEMSDSLWSSLMVQVSLKNPMGLSSPDFLSKLKNKGEGIEAI